MSQRELIILGGTFKFKIYSVYQHVLVYDWFLISHISLIFKKFLLILSIYL